MTVRTLRGVCAFYHYRCHNCGAWWNAPAAGRPKPAHAPACPMCGSRKTRTLSCKEADLQCPTEAQTIGGRQ